ncbi:CobQ/CobB/MinD/ParA nucleotide binding domain-containing protein [Halorubrum xinjiangense]|uniref:CobQ/CobB/MinD/ParA nucleotide binding domain-containing protein n=1 Tax=Halorubrum xinjiangense TaxID=261291 RepID=A0A1G7QXC2_9EURY|nr:CpsD/CapB family tyrosine-protein kinase [Halorubrum xinjiangense]SDG03157.1 CobQ/CobB/MinD/ParA nucleotide binding domain-containing protein [Halorubrum xinjiangense]
MQATTLALVGATGGAGTTRTAVELATMGARDGNDVAVVDAAFTTQGLSEYVAGRIDPDLTALLTDDADAALSAAAYPVAGTGASAGRSGFGGGRGSGTDGGNDAPDLPGRVDAIPARAPFERVARAKTAEAARKLERRIDEAATTYDAVVVDAAPAGSNEAVAAATTADRAVAVRPATAHGRDATQRLRGRIADVGGSLDATLAVERPGSGSSDGEGDHDDNTGVVRVPATEPAVAAAPVAATGDDAYARAIAAAYETAFDASLGVEFPEPGLVDRFTP